MSYFKTTKLTDNYGFTVENTPMDEQRVVVPHRLVGATFQGGTVDANFWTVTNANGGTTTQANNQVTLATNPPTTNASTIIQSVRTARYIGGSSNRFRTQIRLNNTGLTNNERRWGMFNGTDGAYFKLSGTTLSVCTRKTNSETAVASSSWNGSTAVPTLTDCNSFEIYVTNKTVYFVINGVLVHTASFATSTYSDTLNLPVRIDNINSNDSDANCTVECRVATIYRLGEPQTMPTYRFLTGAQTTTCKLGAGTLHRVVITDGANGSAVVVADNISGTSSTMAAINTSNVTSPNSVEFGCPFFTGLTVGITGTVNCTIIYE